MPKILPFPYDDSLLLIIFGGRLSTMVIAMSLVFGGTHTSLFVLYVLLSKYLDIARQLSIDLTRAYVCETLRGFLSRGAITLALT